jgi:hypothetical protein
MLMGHEQMERLSKILDNRESCQRTDDIASKKAGFGKSFLVIGGGSMLMEAQNRIQRFRQIRRNRNQGKKPVTSLPKRLALVVQQPTAKPNLWWLKAHRHWLKPWTVVTCPFRRRPPLPKSARATEGHQ